MRIEAITPGDGRPLRPWLSALAEAGLQRVLLREPELDAAAARSLAEWATDHFPTVHVHVRTAGAASLGLPLHISAGVDAPRGSVFGQSCHSGPELDAAFSRGAQWAYLSPVHAPTSKPGDVRQTLGAAHFLELAAGRPVLALGGITAATLPALRSAWGVAVLGALFGAESPVEAARRYSKMKSVSS